MHATAALATACERLRGGYHMVKGVRAKRFGATFAVNVSNAYDQFELVFNHTDRFHRDEVSFHARGYAPTGTSDGQNVSGTTNAAAMPSGDPGDTLWFRVTSDGTTLTAKSLKQSTAPSDTQWSAASAGYTSTGFALDGGRIGLQKLTNWPALDNLKIETDRDANGSYETTELIERFTLDADDMAQETPEYDAAGNLTYDGVFQYSYDAWNRQTRITKAYRDDAGNIELGSVVQENEYDGLGRRIVVNITNSGDLHRTEHSYYDGWSQMEVRNGSDITTTQQVWAGRVGGYIDELLQIAHNLDWPDALPTIDNDCEAKYWVAQDANYNVQGVLDASGALVERYEYEPYGARRVYLSAGSNDPLAMVPADQSTRVKISDGFTASQGLNPFGHQGLMHDDASEMVNNRARMLHVGLGQFGQRDPLE